MTGRRNAEASMAKSSLLSVVADRYSKIKVAPRDFFGRLPPEAQAELLEVRRQFHAGDLVGTGAKALAAVVVAACNERGWTTCSPNRMREWLTRRDG